MTLVEFLFQRTPPPPYGTGGPIPLWFWRFISGACNIYCSLRLTICEFEESNSKQRSLASLTLPIHNSVSIIIHYSWKMSNITCEWKVRDWNQVCVEGAPEYPNLSHLTVISANNSNAFREVKKKNLQLFFWKVVDFFSQMTPPMVRGALTYSSAIQKF